MTRSDGKLYFRASSKGRFRQTSSEPRKRRRSPECLMSLSVAHIDLLRNELDSEREGDRREV